MRKNRALLTVCRTDMFVGMTLAQNQGSDKSEILVFPETSDKFSRSHVI